MTNETSAVIRFVAKGKMVKFLLPLPDRNDKRFWSTRARRNRRSEQEAEFSPALCGSWRWHIRRVSDSAAPGGVAPPKCLRSHSRCLRILWLNPLRRSGPSPSLGLVNSGLDYPNGRKVNDMIKLKFSQVLSSL